MDTQRDRSCDGSFGGGHDYFALIIFEKSTTGRGCQNALFVIGVQFLTNFFHYMVPGIDLEIFAVFMRYSAITRVQIPITPKI